MLAAQMSDYALAQIEAALRTAPLPSMKMGLFTGNPSLTNATVLADLTALAPTFTGYALATIALGSVRRDALGNYIDPFAAATFQPTAPSVGLPVQLTGYFVQVTVTAVDHLWAAEFLDAPVTLTDEFSALTITYELFIKNLRSWGGVCSVC